MRPRKSSTSSDRPRRPRFRYLGVEATAPQPVPPLSPRGWEQRLFEALPAADRPSLRFRVLRAERGRALVEVARADAPRARAAWGSEGPSAIARPFTTRRTWGTLVDAKAWLRAAGSRPRPRGTR